MVLQNSVFVHIFSRLILYTKKPLHAFYDNENMTKENNEIVQSPKLPVPVSGHR